MQKQLGYREYLSLAIPFIISTITQPLLGAVDTAVLGRLDDASFMGGVAIATVIFNTMYWLLGFLRVSTSGFAAQSLGTEKREDEYFSFFRPLMMALFFGLGIVILQYPLREAALLIYKPAVDIRVSVLEYYNILVWGAPFVLIGYVNIGWLMGRKYVKETLFLQVSSNVLNILLNLIFVISLEWGVFGVAAATLISQGYGFLLGIIIVNHKLKLRGVAAYRQDLLSKQSFREIVSVNSDLFIRTLCLLTMTNIFVATGGRFGKNVLAANAVLFQIQYIFAYFYDGLANASSVYAGRAKGQKDIGEYRKLMKISNHCLLAVTVVITLILFFFMRHLVSVFTNIDEVLVIALEYSRWMVIFPALIAVGLVYYGMFTGTSCTAPVRNSMVIALAVFLGAYFLLVPSMGNNGLWIAFLGFCLFRSLGLWFYREAPARGFKEISGTA